MTLDEIVARMASDRGLTHPDDVAYLREDVAEAIRLYEAPKRWVDVKPDASQTPLEA